MAVSATDNKGFKITVQVLNVKFFVFTKLLVSYHTDLIDRDTENQMSFPCSESGKNNGNDVVYCDLVQI